MPVGAFVVKTFVLPTLALQVQFGAYYAYYKVVRPDGAAQWLFRTQITVVLKQGNKP